MMNDFLGQHMVVTSGGCIAFSSDLFDWPALLQMCAFLQATISPPPKTYTWIKGSFERLRQHRQIGAQCSSSIQDSITELVLELIDRQLTPRDETAIKLDHARLELLERAARHLLEVKPQPSIT